LASGFAGIADKQFIINIFNINMGDYHE
jgi:hypothetical protein